METKLYICYKYVGVLGTSQAPWLVDSRAGWYSWGKEVSPSLRRKEVSNVGGAYKGALEGDVGREL